MSEMKEFEEKMGKSVDALQEDYATIRAGRANPHILDKIKVDYYGTPTSLQQVANISVPEARMIQIQPWEASLIKDIEKAILVSELGITPNNDGKVIRLVFPELTEEQQKSLDEDESILLSSPISETELDTLESCIRLCGEGIDILDARCLYAIACNKHTRDMYEANIGAVLKHLFGSHHHPGKEDLPDADD